jgi:hypothetical protein
MGGVPGDGCAAKAASSKTKCCWIDYLPAEGSVKQNIGAGVFAG